MSQLGSVADLNALIASLNASPGQGSAQSPSALALVNSLSGASSLPSPSSAGSLQAKSPAAGSSNAPDSMANARGLSSRETTLANIHNHPIPAGEIARLVGPSRSQAGVRPPTGRRSRSRSPARRDNNRNAPNPYREERRDEARRGTNGRNRSISPGPQYQSQGPRGNSSRNTGSDVYTGGEVEINEIMTVAENAVGLIIGRMGENLKRVENSTNCKVQFMQPTGSHLRQARLTGTVAARNAARAEIERINNENDRKINGGGGGGGAQGPLSGAAGRHQGGSTSAVPGPGEVSDQMTVPDHTVGLIIGRGGETIRDLQARSGCHVNIVAEHKSVEGFRPVNLIGSYAAIAMARQLIEDIVHSDTRAGNTPAQPRPANNQSQPRGGYEAYPAPAAAYPVPAPVAAAPYGQYYGGGPAPSMPQYPPANSGGGDRSTEVIQVPSDAVGMIIGKGGETIKDMQNTSGAKINVAGPSGADIMRDITLVGPPGAIEAAKRAITDKVDAVLEKQGGGGGGGGARNARSDQMSHGNAYPQQALQQQQQQQHQSPYGQQQQQQAPGPGNMPVQQTPAAPAGPVADMYAPYGGYEGYVALWYASQLAAQKAQGGAPT